MSVSLNAQDTNMNFNTNIEVEENIIENTVIIRLKDGYTVSNFYLKLIDVLLNNKSIDISEFELNKYLKLANTKSTSSAKELIVLKSQNISTEDMIDLVKDFSSVDIVEPDILMQRNETTPNDPSFLNNQLWGLNKIDAPLAWDKTIGSNEVVVGIIDSGVDYMHEDLHDNMWQNIAERDGIKGVDDDNNGYVDDVYGIDPETNVHNSRRVDNHGTHIAGTIGAVGNNGKGVVGVNHKVKIIACNIHMRGSIYFSVYSAIECLNYFAKLKQTGVNIVVTNNSWGWYGYNNKLLYDAIKSNGDLGIMFVAAAGNDRRNNDIRSKYPASYDLENIISVANISELYGLAYSSNYGKTTVDLAAPGINIYSTIPDNKYAYKSGTSMAVPHVTGAVALLKSHPDYSHLTIKETKERILRSTKYIPSLSNKVYSKGILNLNNMLKDIDFAAPSKFKAGGITDNSLHLSWSDNSEDETSFNIYQDNVLIASLDSNSSSYDVKSLTDNTTYNYKVEAVNNQESIGYSNNIQITTLENRGLVALYNSTNGDNWTMNTNWLGDKGTECTWYGVRCDRKHRIIGLDLAVNGLTGTIPKELGDLGSVLYLDLSNNHLTGTIPKELSELENLTVLRLSYNNLTGIIPKELGNLGRLERLVLGHNKLSGTIPKELGNLKKLEHLSINHNNLSGELPKELGDLRQLTSLNLGVNNLSGELPQSFKRLRISSYLLLNNNHLSASSDFDEWLNMYRHRGGAEKFRSTQTPSIPEIPTTPNIPKVPTNIVQSSDITTSVTSWYRGNEETNLAGMIDSNKQTKDWEDYDTHPLNANGKHITFTFDKYYNNASFIFYNRTDGYKERINGSIVEFKKDNIVVKTFTFSNEREQTIFTPDKTLIFDEVVLTFSSNAQNFREIEIFAIETEDKPIEITPTNIVENSIITTSVTSWYTKNKEDNLAGMIDSNKQIKQGDDYDTHPLNADGKNITFTFDKYYNNASFLFYNRTDCCTSRINGSTVEFKKDNIVVQTFTFSNEREQTIFTPDKTLIFDEVVLTFSGNAQNFREIEIFAIEE